MQLKLLRNRLLFLLFGLIFLLSLYLRVAPILNYNFPFTMDQARDMLDIRQIVVGKKPRLIGPTTSINGVYLGPFYYYFNVIPFVLGSGDPSYLVYWNIALYLFGGALLIYTLYKENKIFAILSSVIYLMSPALFLFQPLLLEC